MLLLDHERDPAFIRAIYVAPEWARCGVGTALMQRAEAAAASRGFQRAQLVATLSGEALYRKLGYLEIGRLNIALPDGNVLNGIRMEKSLRMPEADVDASQRTALAKLPHVA